MASDGSQAFEATTLETNALGYLPGMSSMRERRTDKYNWHNGGGAEAPAPAAAPARGNTGTWYGPAPAGSRSFRERAARTERETAAAVDAAGVVGGARPRAAPRAQARDLAVRGAGFRLPLVGRRAADGAAALVCCGAGALGEVRGAPAVVAVTVDGPGEAAASLAGPAPPQLVLVSVRVDARTAAADADAAAAAFGEAAARVPAPAAVGVEVLEDEASAADPEVLHALLVRLIEGAAPPRVLSLPISPLRSRRKIVGMCMRKGVTVIASKPLGAGGAAAAALAETPVVRQLCARYGRSAEAVLLRWCVQRGVACLVPAGDACEAAAAELLEWELHPQDKALIDAFGN